jgi:acyl-CoA reductase-like NAD-dependent aldehyde dehydrogenase
VEDAVEQGARLICGGYRMKPDGAGEGQFFAPTILADVKPSMQIAQHEVFGPVMVNISILLLNIFYVIIS